MIGRQAACTLTRRTRDNTDQETTLPILFLAQSLKQNQWGPLGFKLKPWGQILTVRNIFTMNFGWIKDMGNFFISVFDKNSVSFFTLSTFLILCFFIREVLVANLNFCERYNFFSIDKMNQFMKTFKRILWNLFLEFFFDVLYEKFEIKFIKI